jgi:hypothetical protein
MKSKSVLILSMLALLGGCTSEEIPETPEPTTSANEPVSFYSEKIPYSGNAEELLELSGEEIRAALLKDYPNFDPMLVMETGDRTAFLENYGGHVTEEDVDEVLRKEYSMNDLMNDELFLPENSMELDWQADQRCEEFLANHLQNWPAPFTETTEPFFSKNFKAGYDWEDLGNILEISAFTIPWGGKPEEAHVEPNEIENSLQLTCRERFEDPGGTFDQTTEMVFYYNQKNQLEEIFTRDADGVDFTDGDIFEVVHFEYGENGELTEKKVWGARILANQMVVPQISYYYEQTRL